ncbi:class I SAM-dependent methyltransferase [Microlunatus parietis]|uniref:SAM-dependent methyltransferase n=1 Tax=Microlunatus parietis TaxID=682979 RepID=A0A7Y9I3D9_9ACTN|nr:class I SAM-dependent methyltransferase [Microlunatus parietis]NYE69246.1 SAM-dependent methyltransferase [Microlunatus parietis]
MSDPRDRFSEMYAAAERGGAAVPWDHEGPHSHLRHWLERRPVDGAGKSAVVVGCGYGRDAAHLASLGFRTTGFDFVPEAVAEARRRHGDTGIDLRVADLLALPAEWLRAFDLVFESLTIQSIPPDRRADATAAVASLVAPGGTLVVVASALDEGEVKGPPWPLYRADIDRFTEHGLEPVSIDRVGPPDRFATDPWLAEFRAAVG